MKESKSVWPQQEKKDEDLRLLKKKYEPLMDSFLRLQNEAYLAMNKKGDENAFYTALAKFAEELKKV